LRLSNILFNLDNSKLFLNIYSKLLKLSLTCLPLLNKNTRILNNPVIYIIQRKTITNRITNLNVPSLKSHKIITITLTSITANEAVNRIIIKNLKRISLKKNGIVERNTKSFKRIKSTIKRKSFYTMLNLFYF